MTRSERFWATTVSVTLLSAVLAPVRQNRRAQPRDGFPLSYFPMFTARRGRTVAVVHALAVHLDGSTSPLPHSYFGSGGLNQVRRQTTREARAGGAERLCRRLARRVERAGRGDVVAVRLVRGRYDLDAVLRDGRLVGTQTVLAQRSIEVAS